MRPTFGKKKPVTVQQMQGGKDAAAWNTVREWTGPRAAVTEAMRETVRRISE